MHESLVIYHSTTGQLANPIFNNDKWLRWDTCVRQIAIGFDESVRENFEVYSGPEAYAFFLEVVTGLRSPIVGETEVMGQFRELVESVTEPQFKNKSKMELLNFFRSVLTDAKHVRSTVLKDMGSRSYGSLLRKHIKESDQVNFIGAGKLVSEILPWLKSVRELTVNCRREEQGQKLKEKCSFLKVKNLRSGSFGETLIIAAPISAKEISEILTGVPGIQKIIDLRESSSRDPLKLDVPTMTLAKLFSEIENTEKGVDAKIAKARDLIKDMSSKWSLKAEHRPFGWEDLCG